MRYVTATLGALLIFAGVFIICGIFLTPYISESFSSIHIVGFGTSFETNNIAGVVLGFAAAASSFIATLRIKK